MTNITKSFDYYQCILLFILLSSKNNIITAFSINQIRNYPESVPSQLQGKASKIVGGVEVIPGRYPYMVAVSPIYGVVNCGGTLIHPQWVLSNTACLSANRVEIGRHNVSDSNETYESIDVEFLVEHPNYTKFSRKYDIQLLRLKTPSNFSTVTLDDGSTILMEGSNVTVMGWGGSNNSWQSGVLEEVELDIVDNAACQAAYEFEEITNSVCAASQENGSCHGNVGGPLIIKGEGASLDVQVGVTSFKWSCGEKNPSIFSRVSEGIDFINTMLECNMPNNASFENCCSVQCIDGVFICVTFPLDGFDYSNCTSDPCYVADEECDNIWTDSNIEECNYDGGDCCRQTCTSEHCHNSYFCCKDPQYRGIRDVFATFWVGIFIAFVKLVWGIFLFLTYCTRLLFPRGIH